MENTLPAVAENIFIKICARSMFGAPRVGELDHAQLCVAHLNDQSIMLCWLSE